MKAPEKIYLERILCSNEVYDNWKHQKTISDDIEYIRTDALIEKVRDGIEHLLSGYIIKNFHFGDSYEIDIFIEDLKNYIKKE